MPLELPTSDERKAAKQQGRGLETECKQFLSERRKSKRNLGTGLGTAAEILGVVIMAGGIFFPPAAALGAALLAAGVVTREVGKSL